MRLIDADALRDKLQEEIDKAIPPFDDVIGSIRCGVRLARNIVEDEPTVDAKPVRHGKFIGTEYDGYADDSPVYYEWKCSECGCIFEDDEPTYNYCPNCGARMDADEK